MDQNDEVRLGQMLPLRGGERVLEVGPGAFPAAAVVHEIEQDFTALGDVVNVAARLGSEAKAGELLISVEAANAAAVTSDAISQQT